MHTTGRNDVAHEAKPQRASSLLARSRYILIFVGLGVLLLGGATIFYRYERKWVIVPNFLAQTEQFADLQPQDEFTVTKCYERNSSPQYTIFRQEPAAGTRIRRASQVKLWISQGSAVAVPALVNFSEAYAKAMLRLDDLYYVCNKHAYSANVPEGMILTQYPKQGAMVQPGSTVHTVVSLGPPPSTPPVSHVNQHTDSQTNQVHKVKRNRPLSLRGKLHAGRYGYHYNAIFTSSGGRKPYKWSVSGLPKGLRARKGRITGTCRQSGSFRVTIHVEDRNGVTRSKSARLFVDAD